MVRTWATTPTLPTHSKAALRRIPVRFPATATRVRIVTNTQTHTHTHTRRRIHPAAPSVQEQRKPNQTHFVDPTHLRLPHTPCLFVTLNVFFTRLTHPAHLCNILRTTLTHPQHPAIQPTLPQNPTRAQRLCAFPRSSLFGFLLAYLLLFPFAVVSDFVIVTITTCD
jgi:hypothetical protein